MFSRLTDKQIEEKAKFIGNFIKAKNAADGSAVDANSNVTQKSMATMEAELYKDYTIQINRKLVHDKIEELYDKETADQYIDDLNNHLIYTHDESSTKPYCASISLYPFLLEGTKCLGGISKAPKNLQSFNGSFVNFVYQVASDYAGACESYDQPLIFKNKAGWTHAKPIGEVVSSFPLDNKFISHGEEWEYSDVTGLSVYENGKYVNVPRVYRRKYDDNIYYIKTKTGKDGVS